MALVHAASQCNKSRPVCSAGIQRREIIASTVMQSPRIAVAVIGDIGAGFPSRVTSGLGAVL